MTFKFEIKAWFSGAVLFTVELDAKFESSPYAVKMGEAVKATYLRGANLDGANLDGANLRGANLHGANLRDANLRGANLDGANLDGANLRGANLDGANLDGANLDGANLRGANLDGANLDGANLDGANLRDANLRDANLRGAKIGDYTITKIITRVVRQNDEYEFFAFETDKGILIRAGCQTKTVSEYRDHVAAAYPNTPKAEETLAILDFIEARAAVNNGANDE